MCSVRSRTALVLELTADALNELGVEAMKTWTAKVVLDLNLPPSLPL
jgi:hypothetical protein